MALPTTQNMAVSVSKVATVDFLVLEQSVSYKSSSHYVSESNNILLSDWLKCVTLARWSQDHQKMLYRYTCTPFYMLGDFIFAPIFVFLVELCFIYQYTASANMHFVYTVAWWKRFTEE